MMLSAQALTATRLCAAQNCDQDAEPNGSLCWRCIRKRDVKLHTEPERYTGPTLRCHTCREFKPDEAFNIHKGKTQDRRGRHQECRECCAQRRRLARATMTPAEKRHEADKQNERRRALRAAMTPEQHQARLAKGRAYDHAKRATQASP